ncbi:DUF4279 domain-containing protein [Actinomadura sp. ATCC 39365]
MCSLRRWRHGLGLEPDVVTIRGRRKLQLPHPAVHIWQVNGPRSSERPVDDMTLTLFDRLEPYAKVIGAVAEELARHAHLGPSGKRVAARSSRGLPDVRTP